MAAGSTGEDAADSSGSKPCVLSAGPVGRGDWTVTPGDSMASIADEVGHFWQTIWDDPSNAELKQARKNPETLIPSDKVTIPELEEKQEECAVDMVHRFKRKGVPVKIALKVALQDGTVFKQKPYKLQVGETRYGGKTDDDGLLEHWVAPAAKTGKLTVELNEDGYPPVLEWEIQVGQVPPMDTIIGVQHRLSNLGYECGEPDGVLGRKTRAALLEFQRTQKLEDTGEPDQQTREKLEAHHGS